MALQAMFHRYRQRERLFNLTIPIVVIIVAFSATWFFASRPLRIDAVIGGADSAILRSGFFVKELTPDGMPFRWTSGSAIINLPPVHSVYAVTVRAYIPGDVVPAYITIKDRAFPVATIVSSETQPTFRSYHVLWQSPPTYHWLDLFTSRRFTIDAETRNRNLDDLRSLGISVSHVNIRSLDGLTTPVTPLIIIGVTLLGFARLLWPLRGKRLLWFAGIALLLPIGYDLLVWHPFQGNDYTWLPCSWLPGMVAVLTIAVALAQSADHSPKAALLAAVVVVLVGLAVIFTLQWHWLVEGPDYHWHLNHGGSWQRVFRSHPFYPFGLPLILYGGQQAGDQALLFGRIAGAITTLITIVAVMLLVWRLIAPAYAWVAGMIMLASLVVVSHGALVSTDAPMTGFATLALLALLWHGRLRWPQVLLAGMGLGLAYLFRVQTTMLLIPTLLWLYWQSPPALSLPSTHLFDLRRLMWPLVCLGGFLLTSAPQWILDILDTGLPFATKQYANIWAFAFDHSNLLPEGSTFEQLWFILTFDPYALWRHWLSNVFLFSTDTIHHLFVWPLGFVAFGGLVLSGYLPDRRYLLLLIWTIIYAFSVMLTANKDRFFLPIVPVLAILITAFLAEIHHRCRQSGHRFAFMALLGNAILMYWIMIHLTLAEAELIGYGFTRN